jgi:hypothetical protein
VQGPLWGLSPVRGASAAENASAGSCKDVLATYKTLCFQLQTLADMKAIPVCGVGILFMAGCCGLAHADEGPDLAQLVQNPIAKVISLPFQNNLNFGVGPDHDPQDVLNIQPVLPIKISDDWNVITRTIIPVDYQPPLSPEGSAVGGVGDVNLALYFSPARPTNGIIWGIGPAFIFPSASHEVLGQGKFSTGLSAVALTIRGPWLVGALVTEVTSVSGDTYRRNVDQMLMQPFINYNFPRGWYLTSSPIITANWKAPGSQQWTVPVGAGGGRAFRVGKQALNAQVQAFNDVARPNGSGSWTLRVQFQLLFPK